MGHGSEAASAHSALDKEPREFLVWTVLPERTVMVQNSDAGARSELRIPEPMLTDMSSSEFLNLYF